MKKLPTIFIIFITLLILFSCNSKKETPLPQKNIIPGAQVAKTEQTDPEQSWKESLLSSKGVETKEDIEAIKTLIEKSVENNTLDELQTFLETESKKDKVSPQILFGLSLVYGRKGLVKEEYKIIEKLEEQVKQSPKIAFNLSLVYGRKETLISQIDKAEADALALLQGFISVTSEPPGADVYIQGELKGTTPFTTEGMSEGSYSVELQMEDYITISKTASVKAGETTEFTDKLTLIPGSLVIHSDPLGAIVLLDGEKVGVTPLEISEIEVGEYEISVYKDNYESNSENIIIEPGKTSTISTRLSSLIGKLAIEEFIIGSVVFLDGKRVFPVRTIQPRQYELKNVMIGTHNVIIQKDNFKEKRITVTIVPEQTKHISGKLEMSIFTIPYAKIKIDGKLDDWNGIEPAFIDPYGDQTDNISGTDIIKTFLAKSDTYLFMRMDFSNGKPSSKKEMIYECVVWADTISSGGQYFIEIRLQGNDSNRLKPIISIRKLKNNQNTNVKWNETGSIKIGDSFLEARFPISAFKKYISNELSYNTEIRSWRGGSWDQSYDKVQKKLISFF